MLDCKQFHETISVFLSETNITPAGHLYALNKTVG